MTVLGRLTSSARSHVLRKSFSSVDLSGVRLRWLRGFHWTHPICALSTCCNGITFYTCFFLRCCPFDSIVRSYNSHANPPGSVLLLFSRQEPQKSKSNYSRSVLGGQEPMLGFRGRWVSDVFACCLAYLSHQKLLISRSPHCFSFLF